MTDTLEQLRTLEAQVTRIADALEQIVALLRWLGMNLEPSSPPDLDSTPR